MRRLAEEWATARRNGTEFSAVILDIDHFKQVNDTLGHDAGDKVLIETARIMQRVTRGADACARIGGEEFLVICPNTGKEGALLCAERLRGAVEANTVQLSDGEVRVTISLGIAELTPGMGDFEALLKVADEAVYRAKRLGRNRAEIGIPPDQQRLGA
jgi:diguanylate cyclase (GGDEF)-like protein